MDGAAATYTAMALCPDDSNPCCVFDPCGMYARRTRRKAGTGGAAQAGGKADRAGRGRSPDGCRAGAADRPPCGAWPVDREKSDEHTSDIPALMPTSYAILCFKKK